MKTIQSVIIIAVLSLFSLQASAQKNIQTSTFKVWGNCEMCKKNIETALDVKGVKSAEWNIDTKVATVTFDSTKITIGQIHKLIADAGYDTETEKGSDKAYGDLAPCCQYKRKQ